MLIHMHAYIKYQSVLCPYGQNVPYIHNKVVHAYGVYLCVTFICHLKHFFWQKSFTLTG